MVQSGLGGVGTLMHYEIYFKPARSNIYEHQRGKTDESIKCPILRTGFSQLLLCVRDLISEFEV